MKTKEVPVQNFPGVYKILKIDKDGKEIWTQQYRVRKRFKKDNKWTTHTKTFSNLGEAKAFSKSKFEPIAKIKSSLFEDVYDRFLIYLKNVKRVRLATIDFYMARRKHFEFFNGIETGQVTPKYIDAWLDLLHDPQYLESQHNTRINYEKEFSILSSLLGYYRNHEAEDYVLPLLDRHRERALARSKDQVSEVRYMNESEESKFISSLEGKELFKDLAIFQLNTGCRISEATALTFDNISFSRKEVNICQHLHWERKKNGRILLTPGTKSGPSRIIPLSEKCLLMLQKRYENRASEKVFPWAKDGSWLPYRCIQDTYNRAFKKADIDKSSTHVLRHTFAVRFLAQTKDIYALQRVLGHTDLKVTQVYAKYTNDSVREAFELFSGVDNVETNELASQVVSQQQK